MEPLKVGDYLVWNPNPDAKPGDWRKRYPLRGTFVVTKILNETPGYEENGLGQIIRVRNTNGQRMRGPFWHGWFKKEVFLNHAAKAIQDAENK